MAGVVVASVVLVARAAMAQTAGPAPEPVPRSIVPLTGPSTAPSLSGPAKPEVIPVVAPGGTVTTEGARPDAAGRRGSVTAARKAPRAVKAAHKPAAKAAVKKPTTHVAKAAGGAKTRHVAAAKRRAPGHHAAVGKPVTKRQPPAKGAAPAEAVLPRV
jgi:hypothetical protein